jgi:hypothetical protein
MRTIAIVVSAEQASDQAKESVQTHSPLSKMAAVSISKMGENKTLNLKGITSPKLLQDIMLLISISSYVQKTART